MSVFLRCALLAVVALAGAGCTSSGGGSPSPSPTDTASSSPTTSSSTPTPTPVTSSSSPPLSKFESDPGVQALRAWAAEAATTVNAGHYDSAALDALMTAQLRATIKNILGNSVGYRYPGPLPFTPIAVPQASTTQRTVNTCFVTNGYGIDPKTGKPHGTYKVAPIKVVAQFRSGRWLVDQFVAGAFSCTGVTVQKVGS